MRIFSKQSRTRLLTLLLGGALCASTVVGVATLTEKADAETSYAKPEAVNIETLVDKYADLVAVNSSGGGWSVMDNYWKVNKETSYKTATSDGNLFLGIFDKKGYNENNPVEYDGDVGIWLDRAATDNNTTSSSQVVGIGYKLQSSKITSNGGYGLLSFRTKWDASTGDLALGMMVEPTSPYARWNDNLATGYWIGLTGEDVNIVEGANVAMQSAEAYANAPVEGDELVITYGVWQSAEAERSIYVKVENKTQNNTAYEKTVVDTNLTDNKVFTKNGALAGTFCMTKSKVSYAEMSKDPSLLVAGIDQPLMTGSYTEKYSLKNTSYVVYEGKTLPTLTDSGYAWADPTETADASKTEYDATYSFDYYGKKASVPVTVAVQVKNPAYDSMPEVRNIETLVDEYADLLVIDGSSSGAILGGENTPVNQSDSAMILSGRYALGLYDQADSSNAKNPVKYDGNVGLWYDKEKTAATTGSGTEISVGYKLQSAEAKANGGYGIISFRTKWTTGNGDLSLGMLTSTTSGYGRWQNGGGSGYWIGLTATAVNIIENISNKASNLQTNVAYTNTPSNGDELIITYGVWALNEDTQRAIYVKVYNATTGNVAYEGLVIDENLEDNTVAKNGGELAGTFCIAKAAASRTNAAITADPVLLVAGIDQPLMTDCYSLTDTSYVATEEETLPDLDSGYAWKNPTEKAVADKTEYDATYSFTYYGKAISLPVTVAVQVNALPRVTLKLMDGATELYTERVKAGNTVNFGTLSIENIDTIIGWKLGESTDLLRPDTTFTAREEDNGKEIVYHVVDMDMKQYEGAAIRTTVDENGNGGLRFIAMFNSDDWTANATYIQNAYGVIVPSDDAAYYTKEGGFTEAAYALGAENESFKGMDAYTNEKFNLNDADNYSLYTITMTDVKYANYNRTFASMTYITVTYADATTEIFETNAVMRSVYEVAVMAKSHDAASETKIYSKQQMAVIEGYIANVVDVQYDDTTLTVADRENHQLVRPYVLDAASTVVSNQVTLILTVAEDSLLAKNEYAPVWYTANGNTQRYKATVVYANGTATVSFTI